MDAEAVKARLRQFICAELLRDPAYPLGDHEPLITSGMIESFALAQIGVFIEIEFNVYLPDPELTVDRMNTLADMVARIQEKKSA
jgi:acyl carrier protein